MPKQASFPGWDRLSSQGPSQAHLPCARPFPTFQLLPIKLALTSEFLHDHYCFWHVGGGGGGVSQEESWGCWARGESVGSIGELHRPSVPSRSRVYRFHSAWPVNVCLALIPSFTPTARNRNRVSSLHGQRVWVDGLGCGYLDRSALYPNGREACFSEDAPLPRRAEISETHIFSHMFYSKERKKQKDGPARWPSG